MANEIERKFLVQNSSWKNDIAAQLFIQQGYIKTAGQATVRVRRQDDQAFLTIKGPTQGISRSEFEYPIPVEDATAMLDEFCKGRSLTKTRYWVNHGAHRWEIDVFEDENAGLIVAEIELESEDEVFERPEWIGKEVSDDFRYCNSNLVTSPITSWKQPFPG